MKSEENLSFEEVAQIVIDTSDLRAEELYENSLLKRFIQRYKRLPNDKELRAWIQYHVMRSEEDYKLDRKLRR